MSGLDRRRRRGAGVGATLLALEPVLRARASPLVVANVVNAGDPLGLGGTPWATRLAGLVSVQTVSAPGQHPFADYAANGAVAHAFDHALAMLRSVDA